MIARLIAEHDRIRVIAADLRGYLDQSRAPADPAFARRRWELMRELSAHLACERQMFANRPGTHDQSLDDALRAHMLEWTGVAIQQRWPAYRTAVRVLLRRLLARMEHEERAVFPRMA